MKYIFINYTNNYFSILFKKIFIQSRRNVHLQTLYFYSDIYNKYSSDVSRNTGCFSAWVINCLASIFLL